MTKLLTLTAASHRLNCSAAWVARLYDRGVLPGIRVGGRRLVEEEAVKRLRRARAARQKARGEQMRTRTQQP